MARRTLNFVKNEGSHNKPCDPSFIWVPSVGEAGGFWRFHGSERQMVRTIHVKRGAFRELGRPSLFLFNLNLLTR